MSFTRGILFCGLFVLAASQSELETYKVELLTDHRAEMGEAPHWDIATQSLYYVDVPAATLFRYDYRRQQLYDCVLQTEKFASFIIPVAGQLRMFAVGCSRRVVLVRWDGYSNDCRVVRELFAVEMDDPKYDGNRFNDGKCDPRGRLFAGTMRYVGNEFEYRLGKLYEYNFGDMAVVRTDVGISNGMAWSEPRGKYYYIDTNDYNVKAYDYDFRQGVASNPKVIYDFRPEDPNAIPDGMTIDTEGNLYVANFNSTAIYKIDPVTGKVLMKIHFPAKQVTSAAFGGPNLDILYVTSSSRDNAASPAGQTYKVTGLNARGVPMTNLWVGFSG